jgi:hypothetical protein
MVLRASNMLEKFDHQIIVESARLYCNIMALTKGHLFLFNNAPGKRGILINEPDIGERRI